MTNFITFTVDFVGGYSGASQDVEVKKVGFNWGSTVNQNTTLFAPFVLANDSLEVIAFGNTRQEQHELFETLYFETLDGSGETPDIWGAWKECKELSDSYSNEYHKNEENKDLVGKAMSFIDYVCEKYGHSNRTKALISDMSEYLMFNHGISMMSMHHKTGNPNSYQFCETFFNSQGFTIEEYEILLGEKYEGETRNEYIGSLETPSDTFFNRGMVFNKFTLLTGRAISEIFESKSSENSYACDSSTKREVAKFFTLQEA